MTTTQHRTLWYKSHNYIWIENLRDQDGVSITSATIDGSIKDTTNKEIETVTFIHDNNGNYFTELLGNSKTTNLEKGSIIIMDVTINHSGGTHYMQLSFTIEIDRG